MAMHIPVSVPFLDDIEEANIYTALKDKAISGLFGEFITQFENEFSSYCGCNYGIATSSGTTALHLAVVSLSIGTGDEVLVSTLTNMATFFAVLYQGAKPVPIDIDPETLNLDPALLESKITKRTKAIIVVHLFGHPVDMDPIMEIAKKYNLKVIEDCAQAHGALYKNKKVGSIGDVGCFSFYANKIITTGEGGMLITNDPDTAEKAANLKNLAFGKTNKFMHLGLGYNYRMTNLQAAIGIGQLQKIEEIIARKREIAGYYESKLSGLPYLQLPLEKEYAKNVFWMYHVVLKGSLSDKRNYVMNKLKDFGIETREGFVPYNLQEYFIQENMVNENECSRANAIAHSSFYLPSGPQLSPEERDYVVDKFINILKSLK